jgi:hypothetical protein
MKVCFIDTDSRYEEDHIEANVVNFRFVNSESMNTSLEMTAHDETTIIAHNHAITTVQEYEYVGAAVEFRCDCSGGNL